MSILSEAARILRKPFAPAPTLAAVEGKRRGKAEPSPAPAVSLIPGERATLEELQDLLERLHDERARALALIDSQEERRAELLMQEGSDDAILSLTREADIARLTVERIEVLESEARYQHDLRRDEQIRAEWVHMRDQHARNCRVFMNKMIEMESVAAQVEAGRQSLLKSFPSATDRVPRLPFFATQAVGANGVGQIMPAYSSGFDEAMASFAQLLFNPSPVLGSGAGGMPMSQQARFEAIVRGELPEEEDGSSIWGAGAVFDPGRPVLVGFKLKRRLSNGVVVEPGQKLRVPAGEARALLMAERGNVFLIDGDPKVDDGIQPGCTVLPRLKLAAE